MRLATLLIILMSNQGYWIGGQEGTINIRPAARGGLPAADVSWDLLWEGVKISSGVLAMAQGDQATILRIKPPQCRQRVVLHWMYRLSARVTGQELAHGDLPINVFPDDIVTNLAERVGQRRVFVWDNAGGIPALLDHAKVPYTRVDAESQLQMVNADVVLVGQEMLDNSIFSQSTLMALAENGTSVMLFKQSRPQRLIGYGVSRRDAPTRFEWMRDHPLLHDFELDDLASLTAASRDFSCVELPANEHALELAYYPPETPGARLGPIDAVLLTRAFGAGRLVVCELELGNWVEDPRSQMFLRNAIDYLLTAPQATLSRTDWPEKLPPSVPWVPTIPVYPGGQQ
jgi:hypothetical protein